MRTSRSEPASDTEPRGFVQRPWGGFETVFAAPGYKVKRLLVMPGQRLSLQRHRYRAESWVVVSGTPRVIVSGRARRLRPRESVTVPTGAWHRIENHGPKPVLIVEVQHGPYLGEDDIIRRHDDYGRANGTASASRNRSARSDRRRRAVVAKKRRGAAPRSK